MGALEEAGSRQHREGEIHREKTVVVISFSAITFVVLIF